MYLSTHYYGNFNKNIIMSGLSAYNADFSTKKFCHVTMKKIDFVTKLAISLLRNSVEKISAIIRMFKIIKKYVKYHECGRIPAIIS